MVGIPIDVLNRLLRCVDPHLGGTSKVSCTIDNSRFQNTWPQLTAVVEPRDAFKKRIGVVRHIARAGDAIGEVERAIVVAKMLMIVPQSGHQEATLRVDDLRVCGWFNIGIRSDADNAFASHYHTRCRGDAEIAWIEQPRVANDQIATRNVREGASNALRPSSIGF